MRRLLSCLSVALLTPTLCFAAEPPEKTPAWDWSNDQRLANRCDLNLMRERASASGSGSHIQSDAVKEDHFVIEGAKNPELFMPSELFRTLVAGLDESSESRKRVREAYAAGITRFGWNPNAFWSKLDTVTAQARAAAARQRSISQTLYTGSPTERRKAADQTTKLSIDVCRANADALAAANKTFGVAQFRKFLYTVVAPSIVSLTTQGSGSVERQRLLYVEGGCR
jgi:hypothetical protein